MSFKIIEQAPARLNRSELAVPGSNPKLFSKAAQSAADVVFLDLEDAVAVAEKPATRALVVAALQQPRTGRGYVRVNAFDTPFCYEDLLGVVHPGLDGIVLPKLETVAQLFAVDWLLGNLEESRGLERGAVDLIPIIETGRGVAAVADICAVTVIATPVPGESVPSAQTAVPP